MYEKKRFLVPRLMMSGNWESIKQQLLVADKATWRGMMSQERTPSPFNRRIYDYYCFSFRLHDASSLDSVAGRPEKKVEREICDGEHAAVVVA